MKWKLIPTWRSVKPLFTVRGLTAVALYHACWAVALAFCIDVG